jgi:hypothetical protein
MKKHEALAAGSNNLKSLPILAVFQPPCPLGRLAGARVAALDPQHMRRYAYAHLCNQMSS